MHTRKSEPSLTRRSFHTHHTGNDTHQALQSGALDRSQSNADRRDIVNKLIPPAVLAGLFALLAPLATAQPTPDILWDVTGHDDEVYAVEFATDGASLLSGGGTTARLWTTESGTILHTLGPHTYDLLSAALSPDGALVATGWVEGTYPPGGVSRVWDVATETAIRDHYGCYVAFSPSGTLVATGGGGVNRYVTLYYTDSGAEYGQLYCGYGYIRSLAFSPDRRHLAVGCTDNTVKLFDLQTLAEVGELGGFIEDVAAVAFSPDGSLVAGAEGGWDIDDDAWIRVFRMEDGSLVDEWEAHGQTTLALAFGPSNEIVASSGRDGTAPLAYSIRYWNVIDGALLGEYDELALSLAISPDGSRIAYGGLYGRVVVAAEDIFEDLTAAPLPTVANAMLQAPRPNPFNPMTEIRFELPVAQSVRLAVYNAAGRRLAVLADGHHAAGNYSAVWDGRDGRGQGMPSGIFLVRLETGSGVVSRKISLIR